VFVWLGHEFLEVLPAVSFFAVGFNLILTTTNLIRKDYIIIGRSPRWPFVSLTPIL